MFTSIGKPALFEFIVGACVDTGFELFWVFQTYYGPSFSLTNSIKEVNSGVEYKLR